MSNFWQNLKHPIFCLAPMEDVTDCAFREIFARYGKPDVMFTEFVNVDGLCHKEGRKKFEIDLKYTENQRPIVAQLWGRSPEKFHQAAQIIAKMKFDGIDINMGCPKDREIKLKTCAALIREPKLAGEIIQATIEGARINNSPSSSPSLIGSSLRVEDRPPLKIRGGEGGDMRLPISVKTRIGYSKPEEMEKWVSHLLKYPLAALTIHARTKQEKSKVPAQWEKIREAVEIRNTQHGTRSMEHKILIIGNGDIRSREEGLERIEQTGCDGVMVGRGALGNPWIFRKDNYQPSIKERLQAMLEHAKLFHRLFGKRKPFMVMRKNFKAYASGFAGSHQLRAELMQAKDLKVTEKIVEEFLRNYNFE